MNPRQRLEILAHRANSLVGDMEHGHHNEVVWEILNKTIKQELEDIAMGMFQLLDDLPKRTSRRKTQ